VAEYGQALLVFALAVVVVATGYAAALALAVAREPFQATPFLAGGDPQEHAVSRFHVRWYPLPMLFLAFDMEMVFMYPWAVVVGEIGASAVIEMFLFLGIIMIGVVYAWREGALRWA